MLPISEQEASSISFLPLSVFQKKLMEAPREFCAPALFPAALLNSVSDICRALRREGAGQLGCGHAARPLQRQERAAMDVVFDPRHIKREV